VVVDELAAVVAVVPAQRRRAASQKTPSDGTRLYGAHFLGRLAAGEGLACQNGSGSLRVQGRVAIAAEPFDQFADRSGLETATGRDAVWAPWAKESLMGAG